ncbi:MAG: CgeB family protein [Aggregatilineales bacterium]
MSHRILFVAALHHPAQLLQSRAQSPDNPPLFPVHYAFHFWEKVLKKRGYTLDVFWRNLSGNLQNTKSYSYHEGITPGRIFQAAMRRFPARMNLDYQRRNASLLKQAERFQPDILWMIGDNFVIYPETLQQIKDTHNAKIIYASGTSPIVFAHNLERDAARLYDLVLVNDTYHGMQWLELGAKQMKTLPVSAAIDPDVHYPRQQKQHDIDLAFIGTLLPETLYSERIHALEAIREFDPAIWSVHHLPESLQPYYRGSALGETMLQILSDAKMTLNTHGDFMRYGGNMRLFEAAGMGTFQLVDARPGIKTWFNEGEHLMTYETPNDLHEKVAYYLAHDDERETIAAAARDHALAHHTYAHRLDALETLIVDW